MLNQFAPRLGALAMASFVVLFAWGQTLATPVSADAPAAIVVTR